MNALICIGFRVVMIVLIFAMGSLYANGERGYDSRLAASIPYSLRLTPAASPSSDIEMDDDASETDKKGTVNPAKMVTLTTLTGVGLITAWGVWKWDYFTRSPSSKSEGWFENRTDSGGADKIGHFYSTYATAHGLSWLYEKQGMSHDDAAFYGAFSSFVIMGYMEFGDSFSSYGFSHEDMIANTVGCLAGYALYKYPGLSEKIDIRIELGLKPNKGDALTDYENTKYLAAFKLDGFESTSDSFLKYFELHLGYYTRGFDDANFERERNLFVGIGLNLSSLFRNHGYKRTANILNYVQVPYTSFNYDHDLNK